MTDRADGLPLYVLLGDHLVATITRRVSDRRALAAGPDEELYLAFAALAAPLPDGTWQKHLGIRLVLPRRAKLHGGVDIRDLRAGLPRLGPEPFANGLLLAWAVDQDDFTRDALFETALAANSAAVEARLRALWTGFPLAAEARAVCMALQRLFDWRCPDLVVAQFRTLEEAFALTAQDRPNGTELGAALEIIQSLAAPRPHDDRFQVGLCQAVVNAITHYSRAGRFDALEAWGGCLAAVTRDPAWTGHAEIRLQEARAAVNAINHYGDVGKFDALERWRGRLATVAWEMPGYGGIQEIAFLFGVSHAEQLWRRLGGEDKAG